MKRDEGVLSESGRRGSPGRGSRRGCGASREPYRITSECAIEDPQFQRTISALPGPALIPGNSVVTLLNGDQSFSEMLRAIRGARASIVFETFIFSSGDVGREFASALAERAAAGVKVHLLVDAVGSADLDSDLIRQMRDAGVEFEEYNPLPWFDILSVGDMNYRTHRKLLIVDGRIGFTGGAGIADEWKGDARSPDEWRDTHYRIEGPAVAQLQAAFAENWMETNGRVLHGEAYYPELQPAGQLPVQAFKSSPTSGSENLQLMYLLSIAAAGREILLATPYFVVDKTTEWHLLEARRRGVRIVIIVPGEDIDTPLVRQASRHRWGPLLEAGVEIHDYTPTMYHTNDEAENSHFAEELNFGYHISLYVGTAGGEFNCSNLMLAQGSSSNALKTFLNVAKDLASTIFNGFDFVTSDGTDIEAGVNALKGFISFLDDAFNLEFENWWMLGLNAQSESYRVAAWSYPAVMMQCDSDGVTMAVLGYSDYDDHTFNLQVAFPGQKITVQK